MDENYRVRISVEGTEIEIESTDKDYVNSKLDELISKQLPDEKKRASVKKTQPSKKATKSKTIKKDAAEEIDDFDLADFIAQLKDSDLYTTVEEKVIDKRDMLAKIMMCMHFAAELLEEPFLTTGQIEQITNQLDIKVGMANAANKIKDNQKYFTGKKVRKQGVAVPYKLNRQGIKEFQRILDN